MNKVRLMLAMLVFALTVAWQACGSNQDAGEQQEATTEQAAPAAQDDKNGPEYTSAYVCPMHCPGSGSDSPGKCPKCGMDYVANPNHPMHQGNAPHEGAQEGDMHMHQDGDAHEDHSH